MARHIPKFEPVKGKSMNHVLRVLDHTGDSEFKWGNPNSPEAARARAEFDQLLGKGSALFRTGADGRGEQIREFDPNASEIIAVAPIVAG